MQLAFAFVTKVIYDGRKIRNKLDKPCDFSQKKKKSRGLGCSSMNTQILAQHLLSFNMFLMDGSWALKTICSLFPLWKFCYEPPEDDQSFKTLE